MIDEETQGEDENTDDTPQPYQGKHRRERDDEPPEEVVVDEPTIAFNQTHDWQKRYSDLQSHMDKKVNHLQAELKESKNTRLDVEMPASKDEVAAFQEKYPDIYRVVQTVSKLESDDRVQDLEQTIEALEEKRNELSVSTAEQELVNAHPDWADLSAEDNFTEWLKGQPKSISNGIFKNDTDAPWAIRVVDLYKSDINESGNKKSKKRKARTSKSSAAEVVTITNSGDTLTNEGGEKIWSEQEIRSLKPSEFVKFEKEIDKANREGRIQP